MNRPLRTLRSRITALVAGAVVAVLVLLTIPLSILLHRTALDHMQQSAYDTARAVADYLSTGATEAAAQAYVERANARDDAVPVTVIASDGTEFGAPRPNGLALKDSDSPTTSADPDHDGDLDTEHPVGDRDDDSHRFLPTSDLYVLDSDSGPAVCAQVRTSAGPETVVALVDEGRVRTVVVERLAILGLAGLVLAGLAVAAAELITKRLVRDLAGAADLADTLATGDLDARVPERGPVEVQRVAQALNRLAGRIEELLIAERETVADLSHRLRTPLAALRLDIESLTAAGHDLPVDLTGRLDELERTLTAVIRQARRTEREGVRPAADPGAVVQAAVDFWTPLLEDQARTLTVEIDPNIGPVKAATEDLQAAVDALLENCVAHTEDGVPVSVRLTGRDGGGAVVDVADGGPGFDPNVLVRGRSDRGSTGLGLDIARSCAHASGGALTVHRETHDGHDWTVVRLELGPA